jgi:hypothetical protein
MVREGFMMDDVRPLCRTKIWRKSEPRTDSCVIQEVN